MEMEIDGSRVQSDRRQALGGFVFLDSRHVVVVVSPDFLCPFSRPLSASAPLTFLCQAHPQHGASIGDWSEDRLSHRPIGS